LTQLLKEKVALITGGASGIGYETARAFLSEGASVMIADINVEMGEKVCEELASLGSIAFVQNNVAEEASCQSAVEQTVRQFGRLDIAVNNAGVIGQTQVLHEISADGWQRTMDININGVFFGLKAQVKQMLTSGGGSIVNLASVASKVATPTAADYVTSKHAVEGLTKAAALDYATRGIRINSVGPAIIETPMLDAIAQTEEAQATTNQAIMMHPIGRLGKPEEVASLITWLASDQASFCTGGYYPVNGGYLAH
jgi:NAD(P)-dependent dehydrogenase (short-subunit alcohol dehydrogenase family)